MLFLFEEGFSLQPLSIFLLLIHPLAFNLKNITQLLLYLFPSFVGRLIFFFLDFFFLLLPFVIEQAICSFP